MRLTVSRLGVVLLITSLLLLQLLWSLYHYGAHGQQHASRQSKKATAKTPSSSFPPRPPVPIASFPQLRPSKEWYMAIQQHTPQPTSSQDPPTHSLTVSKPSPTRPYALPLRPLLNPKFTLPQGVSQPSSRWDGSVVHPLKHILYRHLSLAMIAINTKKAEHLSQVTTCKKIF